MIPIYGLIAFLFQPLYQMVGSSPWWVRGFVYMVVIYIVEYLSGTLLTKLTGGHIWKYTSKYNLHGQIQLWPHAPVWFGVGLLVEHYYNSVEELALWLSLHFA
jgi:uncharacterized membrane protein